jgi:hypothetical protein
MNAISQMMQAADACCDACGSAATGRNETTLAIACTLGGTDFKARVAAIAALSRRSLLRSSRDGLVLRLTYRLESLADIQDLVAQEAECCAFLAFDLRHNDDAVRLTITAPASAADAGEELFAHFATELAEVAA